MCSPRVLAKLTSVTMTTEESTGSVDAARDDVIESENDEEEAARIAEEEGENYYIVLADRFGWSRDQIRDKYLDPSHPDPDLLEFLNDAVGCSNEELGLEPDGEFEDA